jgi:ABC-type Fe3+/spermidine/putrescine transport system ATPase subunit
MDTRIHGYFSKSKEVKKKKNLGNTALEEIITATSIPLLNFKSAVIYSAQLSMSSQVHTALGRDLLQHSTFIELDQDLPNSNAKYKVYMDRQLDTITRQFNSIHAL